MNYRHVYHAGNFADVLKHLVLTLVLEYLKQKPSPFRVIDTHAGIGLYDLASVEAQKTGEWRHGIGRLLAASDVPASVTAILAPYLSLVRAENAPGDLTRYPGSPLLARRLLRTEDRLVANELHPEDCAALRRLFSRDAQTKVLELDAWIALKSLLPPKERRGVVLVDPPFEQPRELDRLLDGLVEATHRFATGIFLLWYPIKDPAPVAAFHRRARGLDLPKVLVVEQMIRGADDPQRLNGCGLLIVNAPYALAPALNAVLPFLAPLLAQGPGSGWRVDTFSSA
jgi:23S rRNA (adenine2030-N6)-methyltransferase